MTLNRGSTKSPGIPKISWAPWSFSAQSMGKRGHRSVPDKTFLHDRPHSVILQALAIPVLSGTSFVHGG
jgi:hypothetical protein